MDNRPSDSWFVRASSLGALMKKGRGKDKPFGDTATKEILAAALFNKRGYRKQIYSKYLDKGIINEPEALKMLCKEMKWNLPEKLAKKRHYNEYITGEPDLWLPEQKILADVKCSYDPMTFPYMEDELTNTDYIWQMQSYMWLCDVEVSYLAYCLTDNPEQMREREVYFRTQSKMNYPESIDMDLSKIELDVEEEVAKEMTFGQFPASSRIKVYTVHRDEDKIEEIRNRVDAAREIYDVIYTNKI